MNPHYHPYGGAGGGAGGAPPDHRLSASPAGGQPPSPDALAHGYGARMHHANGHAIGAIGMNGPHDPHAPHHAHPAFATGGGQPSDGPHHQQQHHNPVAGSNGVKICAGCGGKIVERFYLHALDRFWHNSCLKCSCCAAMLADLGTSCYTKSGMILCKQDYTRSRRLFCTSACSACGQMIAASELVMRSGGSAGGVGGGGGPGHPHGPPAPQLVFHIKCFMCSKCLHPLVQGDRYYMVAGSLVCEQDWHKLLKSSATAPTLRKGKVGRPRRSRD